MTSPNASPIDAATVRHVATLANLRFDEAAEQRLAHDMGEILAYMAILDEVDTEGVEPLIHPVSEPNTTRPDRPVAGLSRAQALANAPSQLEGLFEVPRVLNE